MKQIYICENIIDAQLVKDFLENTNIPCLIKGEFLQGALGEIPVNTFPTIWITDDNDEARAKLALKAYTSQAHIGKGESWVCSNCSEVMEAHFSQCWNCSQEREIN